MSWPGGSVAGAPYRLQSQPNSHPQAGYGQQPHQFESQSYCGQNQPGPSYPGPGPVQRPPDSRLPKKKGNPIITRYPPPPGYCGPAQPQGPFGTNQQSRQYQSQQSGYPQAPLTPFSHPAHGYCNPSINQGYPAQNYSSQPSTYPRTANPQGPNVQWPQLVYPSNQCHYQPQNHPMQIYPTPQNGYPGYHPQSNNVDSNTPAYGSSAGWPPLQHDHPSYPSANQYNPHSNSTLSNSTSTIDPNSTPTPANAGLVATQPSQLPNQTNSAVSESGSSGKLQLFLAWDDWDFDFDGAIWPKSNEPIDPNLSLGVIIWHPAKQMTRALPSTFAGAEEQALKPTPETLDNGESVSMYFTVENSHEAFLDVRQTDEWEHVRNDPIFVTFTDEEMDNNLISLDNCIAQRDRPDDYSNNGRRDENEAINDATWDIMDNLEQALSDRNGVTKNEETKGETASSNSTQARILVMQGVNGLPKTQEDILALLGVTGLPKPPSNHSLPIQLPGITPADPPPIAHYKAPILSQKAFSFGGYKSSRDGIVPQRAHGSMSSSSKSRPTPPLPLEDRRHNSWHAPQQNEHRIEALGEGPAHFEERNRSMTGFGFNTDSPIPEPKQGLHRSDSSRKRSYQDTDQEGEKHHQINDQTKRKRRLQIDAAYSRR